MSYWNHRIVKYTTEIETIYQIAECHFGDQGEFRGWTPLYVMSTDLPEDQARSEMRTYVERMLKALDEPVIETTEEG